MLPASPFLPDEKTLAFGTTIHFVRGSKKRKLFLQYFNINFNYKPAIFIAGYLQSYAYVTATTGGKIGKNQHKPPKNAHFLNKMLPPVSTLFYCRFFTLKGFCFSGAQA